MERMLDKEEAELWNKGNCQNCNKPLAVINDNCQDLQHQQEGVLLKI